jgi:hypothetical protein
MEDTEMSNNQELRTIVTKLSECGWDVIDAPAKKWLSVTDCADTDKELVAALKQADADCGSCGCEMDPLYKKALEIMNAA